MTTTGSDPVARDTSSDPRASDASDIDVSTPAGRTERATRAADARWEAAHVRRQQAANDLPPLRTVEDALERLNQIGVLAVSGALPGAQASAASRSVEAWLNAQRHLVSVQKMRALEARIVELTAELTRARAG